MTTGITCEKCQAEIDVENGHMFCTACGHKQIYAYIDMDRAFMARVADATDSCLVSIAQKAPSLYANLLSSAAKEALFEDARASIDRLSSVLDIKKFTKDEVHYLYEICLHLEFAGYMTWVLCNVIDVSEVPAQNLIYDEAYVSKCMTHYDSITWREYVQASDPAIIPAGKGRVYKLLSDYVLMGGAMLTQRMPSLIPLLETIEWSQVRHQAISFGFSVAEVDDMYRV